MNQIHRESLIYVRLSGIAGGVDGLELHVRCFGGRLIGGVSVEAADEIEGIVFRDEVVENDAAEHESENGKKNLDTRLSSFDVVVGEEAPAHHHVVDVDVRRGKARGIGR